MLLTILLQAVAADVLGKAGIALAAALAALAAGYGIGKIGSSAAEKDSIVLGEHENYADQADGRKPAEASVLQ